MHVFKILIHRLKFWWKWEYIGCECVCARLSVWPALIEMIDCIPSWIYSRKFTMMLYIKIIALVATNLLQLVTLWFYRSVKMYWMTQGHSCGIDEQDFPCQQDKVRTTQPISTKLGSYNPLVMHITWLDFGGILLETFFAKFSLKILDVFFQGQTLYWTYLKNGWSDWCEMKRRCINWVLSELCDIDLWPHPWSWPLIFQGQTQNSCISGIVIWCETKRKQIN